MTLVGALAPTLRATPLPCFETFVQSLAWDVTQETSQESEGGTQRLESGKAATPLLPWDARPPGQDGGLLFNVSLCPVRKEVRTG